MGQVTIYIDDKTEANMNAAVKASGVSKSKWVARVIREKAGGEWSKNAKALAGAWQDLPMAEDIRQTASMDTLIAGVAMANHGVLVTHNIKGFSRVQGLGIEDWF